MIDFFLSPVRIKALLAGGGVLLAVVAGLGISCLFLSGKLDTERAAHKTTKLQRDTAVQEGVRWKTLAAQESAKIPVFQEAMRECIAREAAMRRDEAAREAVMRTAKPRERTETERKGVVDDATRKAVADRLNRPL